MKNIVILGAGESGTGAAILARKKGFDVFVSDSGLIDPDYKNVLLNNEISFEEGVHSDELILKAEEVIKSPGIPDTIDIIRKLKKHNIPVISEIEFACRNTTAKKIGITGTNGKTTTTSLIGDIWKNAGLNVGITGNIGNSFAKMVAEDDKEHYIIELSSFQLDSMYEAKMDMAVLLNITPDHLDRYDHQFEKYIRSKMRITKLIQPEGYLVYNADDTRITDNINIHDKTIKYIPVSIKRELNEGAFIQDQKLIINIFNNKFTMNVHELALSGQHNLYNSAVAAVIARLNEISNNVIKNSLSLFHQLEHRLERLGTIHGIEFINDSKATNVDAAWYALESMSKSVIWIVGGVDKGNDYSILEDLVKRKVKILICLGADNTKLVKAFSNRVELILETKSMKSAVHYAYQFGKKGDVVLLAPACSSFDLFKSYKDRGNQFKNAVRSL